MGCSASATQNPEPNNFCGNGDTIGMTADVENACFFSTDIGTYCASANIGHNQYCFGVINGATGPDTEWVPSSHSTLCGVCSSCNGIEQGNGNGLCGFGSGSCSWAGVRYKCQRIAFNGDFTKCCRRSPSINGNLFCFDNDTMKATCDPAYRGFAQNNCIGIMETYCSSDTPVPPDPLTETMVAKWTGTPQTKDCLRFVAENQGKLPFYQPVINAMVFRYLITLAKPITSSSSDGPNHDPFIDTIVQICRVNPGACDTTLLQKCQGVTRQQLETNINLVNLCGCFMDDIEYSKFSQFGINRICDPVCVIGSTVKPLDTTSDPNDAKFLECKQSICVIDDVTIQILGGSATGDITFAQACGSCANNTGAGSCRCYISDVTLQAVDSLIGDVSFKQTCGTPICFRSNPTAGGAPIQVDCETGAEVNNTGVSTNDRSNWLWILLAILVIGLILLIIFTGVQRSRRSREPTIIMPAQQGPTRPLISSSQGNLAGGPYADRSLAGARYVPRSVV